MQQQPPPPLRFAKQTFGRRPPSIIIIMTEVRKVVSASGDDQWGVFATRRFAVGEIILREAAPWKLWSTSRRRGQGAHPDNDDDDNPEHRIGCVYQEWLRDLPIVVKTKKKKNNNTATAASSTRTIRAQDCFASRATTTGGGTKDWTASEKSKLACMLMSILRFVDETTTSAEERAWLLDLYHPSMAAVVDVDDDDETLAAANREKQGGEEREIVELSRWLLEWLDEHVVAGSSSSSSSSATIDEPAVVGSGRSSSTTRPSCNPLAAALQDHKNRRESLQRIALVWACNAFAGGRIYRQFSRLNHSCQPNAIVQVRQQRPPTTRVVADDEDDEQWIRAMTTIEPGQEITISYLPIEFLYAETSFRQNMLHSTKYFSCHCPRCNRAEQVVTAIPCLKCHPRTRQGMLEEDVQYDDDHDNNGNEGDDDGDGAAAARGVHYAWLVNPVAAAAVQGHEPSTTTTTTYRCSSCQYGFPNDNPDDDRMLRTHQIVSGKIAAFLASYQHQASVANSDGGDDAAADVLMEYTSLSSSVHGALYWTTNVLLYYQLDAGLQEYHRRLLADTSSQEPDLDQVAEFVDMLMRLCRFVRHNHADLPWHRGHWLADVIIGTARALVALGDRKSQQYASDWLSQDDFGTFVRRFEPDHLQTVVESLRTAWTRDRDNNNDPSTEDNDSPNKRRKA